MLSFCCGWSRHREESEEPQDSRRLFKPPAAKEPSITQPSVMTGEAGSQVCAQQACAGCGGGGMAREKCNLQLNYVT